MTVWWTFLSGVGPGRASAPTLVRDDEERAEALNVFAASTGAPDRHAARILPEAARLVREELEYFVGQASKTAPAPGRRP